MEQLSNITKIINFEKFQTVQDAIANATKLALITVDYKGAPLTNHSNCTEFCKLARENPLSSKHCQKCDSRGGLEAVRQNKPYTYLCHYNLVDLAVPIIVDNKYLGAVMAGQVKLTNIPESCVLEQIIAPSKNYSLIMNLSAFNHAYEKIPSIDYELFQSYAELISATINYTVDESIAHIYTASASYTTSYMDKAIPSLSAEHFVASTKPLPNTERINNSKILTPASINYESAREVIQPLLTHLEKHPNIFITSSDAAKLCNVTSSHFSKTFKKVMTVGYVEYINELKITWAKEFLTLSNNSIEKISENLGYNSTSYFIKTFKKYENLTPTLYRKYYGKTTNVKSIE